MYRFVVITGLLIGVSLTGSSLARYLEVEILLPHFNGLVLIGDWQAATKLIDHHPELLEREVELVLVRRNYRSWFVKEKGTPLVVAVAQSRDDVVRVLLDRGANVNPSVSFVATPLAVAARRDDAAMVRLLLARGADPSLGESYMYVGQNIVFPFSYALRNDSPEVLAALLDGDSPLPACDNDEWIKGREFMSYRGELLTGPKCLDLLRRKGRRFEDGRSLLHYAAAAGWDDVVQFCIEDGMDIDQMDAAWMKPLDYSLHAGRDRCASLLVAAGAELDGLQTAPGTSVFVYGPLLYAVCNGMPELTVAFLKRGFDPNEADPLGWTAMHYAAANGEKEIERILREHGGKVDRLTSEGWTIEKVRAMAENCDGRMGIRFWFVGPEWLRNDDGSNEHDFSLVIGHTSEHLLRGFAFVKKEGRPAIFVRHLETELNWVDRWFSGHRPRQRIITPSPKLFMAVYLGNPAILKRLLDAGTSVNTTDSNGFAPLDWAVAQKMQDLLRNGGAKTRTELESR